MISFEAFLDELDVLGVLKTADDVTRVDAQRALERLNYLESAGPTPGQLARGAAVGALAGPVASNVNKLISSGKLHTPREMAGQVAGGLILGTAVPLVRQKIETGAERRTLRDYMDEGHAGRLAAKIEDKLAV